MSEMVDRVAKALADKRYSHCGGALHDVLVPGQPNWKFCVSDARTAIEAMREPTDDMKATNEIHWGYSCHICGGLTEGWYKMIDTALL